MTNDTNHISRSVPSSYYPVCACDCVLYRLYGRKEWAEMTNAERLRVVKYRWGFGIENGIEDPLYRGDIDWLIQQAERAQELEWALNQQRMEYDEENDRLRKALEFYADDDNWIEENISGNPWSPYYVRDIHQDEGDIARLALAGKRDG